MNRDALRARLQASGDETWERLRRSGRLRPGAVPPELALPRLYEDVLLKASRALEAPEALLTHHLDWFPGQRVEQLATQGPGHERFLHTPLSWDALPRIGAGVRRLFELCAGAGVDPEASLGAPTFSAFIATRPTLAALYERTCFGGAMPMLYAFPHDLESYSAEVDAGEDVMTVIDRRFAAPICHELAHFGRDRDGLLPPLLDEGISGYLGVHIHRQTAYPTPGGDDALYAAPWLAQVGQLVVRLWGLDAVVRAQAGVVPWTDVLGAPLVQALRDRWWGDLRTSESPQMLSDHVTPWSWLEALVAGCPAPADDPTMDVAMTRDALAAMCLRNFRVGAAWRVAWTPSPCPVTVDATTGRITRASCPDSEDVAPPAYILSPTVAARLLDAGRDRIVVQPTTPTSCDHLARSLVLGDVVSLCTDPVG